MSPPPAALKLATWMSINLALISFAHGEGRRVLRQLKDIPKFRSSGSAQFADVDFVASVTYWDADRCKLFVQDDDEAIYLYGEHLFENNSLNPRFGARVRVVGEVAPDADVVFAERVEVLQGMDRVDPIPVEFANIEPGENWSQYVRTEGKLERVVRSNTHTQLVLTSGDRSLVCYLRDVDRYGRFDGLVGARLRVSGVLDWEMDDDGNPTQMMCQIMSQGSIFTVSSSTPESVAAIEVKKLTDLATLQLGIRVSVTGMMTCFESEKSFIFEDATAGIPVICEGNELLHPGIGLRIDGILTEQNGIRSIELTRAAKLPDQNILLPLLKTTPQKIVANKITHRRVAVVGTVKDIKQFGQNCSVLLNSGQIQFCAEFIATKEELDQLDFQIGERLGCHGVVFPEPEGSPHAFSVRISSLDYFWGDRESLHLNRQTAKLWAVGLAGLVLLVGSRLIWLRTQIAQKRKRVGGLTARINASYQAIKEGMIVLDSDNRVASVNSQFTKITGMELDVGYDMNDLSERLRRKYDAVNDDEEFWTSIAGDLSAPITTELHAIGDSKAVLNAYLAPVIDDRGTEIGRLLSLQDVTEQKELEDRLIQSQKMEAVGSLAGGIAHDFNNLLMVMSVNIEFARSMLAGKEQSASLAESSLVDVEAAVGRARDLVKNLLSFSRRSDLNLNVHCLNDSVVATANLIRRTFSPSIELETNLDASLSLCRVDLNQIEQVIMNVCLNARDAIGAQKGKISIATATVSSDGGPMVRIRIEDNGVGMSEAVRSRLFEPFFTTKPVGKGTGLGMSTSYGIVVQHGGWIECDSQLGRGTVVSIFLPAMAESAPIAPDENLAKPNTANFDGRILVVDDEPSVRHATAKLIQQLGCDVIEASNGSSAIELARENQCDLVLLDLNMPEMNGHDVFRALNAEFPELPVVICTGYLKQGSTLACDDGSEPTAMLQKPFGLKQLSEVCQQTIGTSS